MAVTSAQIVDFLLANPGMTDAQIVSAMEQYGVSPDQMAAAVNLPVGEVVSRVAATVPEGMSVTLGDTRIAPQYEVRGSGEDRQVVGIENITVEKTTGDINYKSPVGSEFQNYSPTGEFIGTGVTTSSGQTSFFGGLVDMFKDPVVLAALAGGYGAGLFGGAGALSGATALTAAEAAGLGLTAAEAASLGLSATEFAAATGAAGTAGLLSPTVTSTLPTATLPAATAASTIPAATAASTAVSALTPTAASVLAPAAVSALRPTAANIATSLLPTAVKSLFTPTNIGNIVQQGTQTAAGLLQQQTSKEAAQKAQAMIDAETAAAKTSAQFRPIGMTTRFGTSQFVVDPKTGQLTSAGYTLSPEAKNAQDRFLTLAGQGLTQAEGAPKAFEPLQLGAQSLFKLGQGYLAQSPEQVAQDYLKNQMSLLQPSREIELANLQTRLRNQGRIGLSVAQGGDLGATTPELQALFNARARQEAELAANAQQLGQRDVLFGAGLYDLGTKSLGNYYAGQQQAYAPFTTAFGQMQALESAAQQPFQMGVGLGQTAAQAGFNVGQLGLRGAGQSVALATGADATRNPYASALSGAAANPMFGQVVGGLFGSQPATSGFSYGKYGTGIDPSTGEYFGSLYF